MGCVIVWLGGVLIFWLMKKEFMIGGVGYGVKYCFIATGVSLDVICFVLFIYLLSLGFGGVGICLFGLGCGNNNLHVIFCFLLTRFSR